MAEENNNSIRTMTQKMDDYREDINREKQMAVSKISTEKQRAVSKITKTLQEELKDPSTYREIEKYITLQFGSTEWCHQNLTPHIEPLIELMIKENTPSAFGSQPQEQDGRSQGTTQQNPN